MSDGTSSEHQGESRKGAVPEAFGVRLGRAIERSGPLCVGIDAHPAIMTAWGLPSTPAGLLRLSMTVIEAVAGHAAAIKPQVAWYEAYGSGGMAVLEQTLAAARDHGLLTIADAKRGDIGSTMEAYAYTWLSDDSTLAADAVTLSPYLGAGSLEPAFELAEATGRGTFVLALTSNPEGASVQHVGGTRSVAARVVEEVEERNMGLSDTKHTMRDQIVIKPNGLVVGATVGSAPETVGVDLSTFSGPVLAPGYGAQGATAGELGQLFSHVRGRVLVNSARGILRAGPDPADLRASAQAATEDLRRGLGAG
ncbi:orotidine-5'-phosphate decarboxylase [Kocuria coralli]|uniref:Orotidine-5'-phosphate decarboxylase n=1 Tax=Kocuria coralli TaxID=1461025 RepID=A0A5J5KZT6_9MICC|nr:orotidine-5'-phosphate decarboxylase [Kocuria coralli]KAA9395083.1 orotidine-5'-phosphate decarboxylase [Kocuria coralli]